MVPTSSSKLFGILSILALLITMFVATETMAQSCNCYDSVNVVPVRPVPPRRAVAGHKVKRSRGTSARVRTVYRTVYVPTSRVASYVAYSDNDNCSEPAARVVVAEPAYMSDYDSDGSGYITNRSFTNRYDFDRIARGWGQRDGFKDGYKAGLKYRPYDPENNGDYRDADNGYKDRFGSRFLYKSSYRQGYVRGYDAGYRSVTPGNYVIRY